MAAFTQDDLRRYQAMGGKLASDTAPKKKGGRGGFLTSLISEGGGLGGASAGAMAGTAILPGLGTLIGAGLGGLAGSFTGRLAENKIRDNEFRASDALKEGLISGTLAGRPIKLLKGGLAGSKALLAGESAVEGANKAINAPGIASKILGNLGNRATTASLKASPSQLTKFAKETGEDIVPFMQKNKLIGKDVDALKNIRPQFQSVYDSAISGAKTPIPLDDIMSAIKSGGIGNLIKSSATSSQKIGRQSLDEIAQALGRGTKKEFAPSELLGVKRDFDKAVKNYKFDDATKAIPQNVSDTIKEVIRKAIPETKESGQNLQKLNKLIDIEKSQENVGRGKMPFGITDMLAASPGGTAGMIAGGPAGLILGAGAGVGAKRLANSPKLASVVANLSSRQAGRVPDMGNPLSIAGRQLPIRGASALLGAGASTDTSTTPQPTAISPDQQSPEDLQALLGGLGLQSGGAESGSTYSMENAAKDIQDDLQRTGGENMDKYMKLYQFMNPEGKAKKKTEAQVAREEAFGLSQDALSALGQGSIETGPLRAKIQDFKGMFNKGDQETVDFNRTIGALRSAIVKARGGSAVTPTELKLIDEFVPKSGDSEQLINSKLQRIAQTFGQASADFEPSTLDESNVFSGQ